MYVSARSTLYDQHGEREFFEAAGSKGRRSGRLERVWLGDLGDRKEHDATIMLCKFCWECPARFF